MDSTTACFFPTLNTTAASQDEMQIYLAPVHLDLVRLQEFSSTREVPAACVASAAWLLVLRLYTGCDTPSTGFVQTEGAQLQCCSVDFEDGSLRLHQIIDSLRFHILEKPSTLLLLLQQRVLLYDYPYVYGLRFTDQTPSLTSLSPPHPRFPLPIE
jgi:hypothetical protein